MKKKILFLTGSRAEYGLLKNLIKIFKDDKEFKTYIAVTGSHLSKKFGNTYEEISKDGFHIDKELKIPLIDSSNGVSKAISKLISVFSEYLEALKPDLLIVLGDRYEVFAGVTAAHVHNIKIAHIHGGELTEGAFDDAFRHSITKMATLHFTACDEYRNRVIQLGEIPSRVFNFGPLGLESISKTKLVPKKELEKVLDLKFLRKNLVVTFHPETNLSVDENNHNLEELLAALNALKDTCIIFTGVNADTGFKAFKDQIKRFCRLNQNAYSYQSLGQVKYFSCLREIDMIIGNSSSGILEAPAFFIPSINIGNRQKGRLHSMSVINCRASRHEILKSIKKAFSFRFTKQIVMSNPYKKQQTSKKIFTIIKKMNFNKNKVFYDINF